MSEREINLNEILKKELIPTVYADNPDLTFNATIKAMREACFQILELAAENAVYEINPDDKGLIEVIRRAILDTIKQVE